MFGKVSDRELIFFTSQLSLLMETGSSLTESLSTIETQIANRSLREAVQQVSLDVQSGKMLSTALGRKPKLFTSIYVSMIRAGETGGFLVEMLHRLVQILKLKNDLKTKIKSAMAYPAVLIVMSTGVLVFMVTFVLPRFAALFEGKEAILPATTKVLMAASSFAVDRWPLLLGGLVALIVGALFAARSTQGRIFLQRLILRVPLIGVTCRILYASRLLRTLGVMLESGIPLLDGVEVTRGTVGNREYVTFLDHVEESVKEGKSLSEPFAQSPLFAPVVKQMVHTAEMTGSTGTVMLKMADYYEEEMEVRLKTLTAMLEPLIVVVMGSVVGFIAMSLFLPLFKISRSGF
jgi:type II secretory pathway component PulF